MVKRVLGFGLFAFSVAVLGGCPIYGDSRSSRECTTSSFDSPSSGGAYTCYDCPSGGYYTSSCSVWSCNTSYDCPSGASCDNNVCTKGGSTNPPNPTSCTQPGDCASGQNCGTDDKCHTGDCSNSGCPSGYQCKLSGGTLQCVGGAKDGGAFTGCTSDAACSSLGAGSKCLNGDCVAPANQCSDATQCPNSEQCVQGVCTPSCSASNPCPTGYACDATKGVCSVNPMKCGAGGTSCSGTTTCVDQHCVTPCGSGNTCSGGLICVDGGCIPDQKPQFICSADGPGVDCAPGSLCLHHSCYIGCSADAGASACRNADKFNVCKSVTTSSGSYQVCGSSSNLGTECDPTQGRNCANPSLICIDGFCR